MAGRAGTDIYRLTYRTWGLHADVYLVGHATSFVNSRKASLAHYFASQRNSIFGMALIEA